MADVLSTTHREITKRLDELKPLVEEYARLEAAERALRGIPAAPTANKPGCPRGRKPAGSTGSPAPTASRKAPASRRRGRRKGTGGRAAQTLALVQGQPGITIPELAIAIGINQTTTPAQ